MAVSGPQARFPAQGLPYNAQGHCRDSAAAAASLMRAIREVCATAMVTLCVGAALG